MSEALERRLAAVMFTDMVGYTALLAADEQASLAKRGRYWDVLEAQHEASGGTIVQRLGDGSMSMFPSALAAVQAAVAIQQELAAADVSVRVGIHVGEVIVEPERLSGEAVNIASRIESFAVPGGVMLSDSAFDQVKNRSDVGTVRLGQFRLKNVGRPFELYAVSADGIVVPDLDELEGKGERFASLPSNLPAVTTSLVGRAEDIASLAALVEEHRVVTIAGPGGVGKTRVLVELGRQLGPDFLDGTVFVPLADVAEADGFVPTVAEALDVKEAEGRTLAAGIAALIGDRKALLLLDNLEQIIDGAAAEVAKLVEACPELRVVATSRTPLWISPEREYALAPLELDSAVTLFVERARSLELTAASQVVVETVCRRLDGLPLALELAAARLRFLSPEALLERLDHALDVLQSGARDAPGRQQTLRATIEWSHSLLDEREKRLFRRLAVFAGGTTFPDVEAVCADPGTTCLDELESLVDKALVQADGQAGRLRLLQTIADYAQERLEASGEADDLAGRHALRYAEVAGEIRDGIEGATQVASVERGIAEEANVHAALDTLLGMARGGDAAAAEVGLQVCADLVLYWHFRGKNLTAREYATAFLDADTRSVPSVGRAGALRTAGLASWMLGEFDRANDEWAEAYRNAAEIDNGRERCLTAGIWGFGLLMSDVPAGLELTGESIERGRALGFTWAEAFALTLDGVLQAAAGELDTAKTRFEQALDVQRRIGDEEGAGLSLGGLAQLAAGRGDLANARDLYRQSLAAFEAIGDRAEEARILSEMAWTHLQDDDSPSARREFLESVQAYTDLASVRGVGESLVGLAAVEAAEGRPERAVQIAAAAEVYAEQEGIVNVRTDETPGREVVEQARAALSADELARATEIGRRLTIEEALELSRLGRETLAS